MIRRKLFEMGKGLAVMGIAIMTGCSGGGEGKHSAGALRYVALGDSLTVGYGATKEQSYPWRIVEKSRLAHTPLDLVKNLANGGHTLAKVQLVQLPQVETFQPDIVTLWVGTNDALLNAITGKNLDSLSGEPLPTPPEVFESRLNEVLVALSKMNLKHIFIAKLHDLSSLPVANGWEEEKKQFIKKHVDAYNEIFDKAAERYSAITLIPLDELPTLQNPKRYMNDGIHPRPLSYKQIAEAWWKVMREKLKETASSQDTPSPDLISLDKI